MSTGRSRPEPDEVRRESARQIRRSQHNSGRLAGVEKQVAEVEDQVADTHERLADDRGDPSYRDLAEQARQHAAARRLASNE